MKIAAIMSISLLAILIIAGCTSQQNYASNQTPEEPLPNYANPVQTCISKCYELVASGTDLSRGPCILNPIPDQASWVCDVAHYPRADVDNMPENQCSAYGTTAAHFVEVTPQCQFIRAV